MLAASPYPCLGQQKRRDFSGATCASSCAVADVGGSVFWGANHDRKVHPSSSFVTGQSAGARLATQCRLSCRSVHAQLSRRAAWCGQIGQHGRERSHHPPLQPRVDCRVSSNRIDVKSGGMPLVRMHEWRHEKGSGSVGPSSVSPALFSTTLSFPWHHDSHRLTRIRESGVALLCIMEIGSSTCTGRVWDIYLCLPPAHGKASLLLISTDTRPHNTVASIYYVTLYILSRTSQPLPTYETQLQRST